MGMLTNVKNFLAGKAISAAKKAGDEIATFSALSPKQLQEVDAKRNAYLNGKPDIGGEEIQSLIRKNMGAIGIEVYQAYLEQLSTIYYPVDVSLENFDEDNRIRFFDITKWVTDSEEQSLDKLVNVYHVLSEEECNIALIYHRSQNTCNVSIGVVNTDERQADPAIVDSYYSRVLGAIKGNFPGADIRGIDSQYKDFGIGIPDSLQNINSDFEDGRVKSVAIVSNVASEKSEEFISQSMEKLLDGIVPEDESQEYTIVLLAKPIKEQLEYKNRLYELYTMLAPYTTWQTGYTYTESDGITSSANFGVNLGVGVGTHSVVNGAEGTGMFNAVTSGNYSNFGIYGSDGSNGASAGFNASANFGVSFFRSSCVTANVGKNESITQTYTNYGVKHTLDIIESQLKRIEESSALGMWDFASYIISDSPVIANNVAHMYLALTQGEKSYITKAAVNFWDGDIDTDAAKTILESIRKLQHPVFGLKSSLEDEWLMYPTLVTPTTPLSGKELARALNFPRKSVSGLPVFEVVPFGREPNSLLDEGLDLDIGCGYHMRKAIPEQRIALSKEALTKHTFITGSTGSGKSNTVYRLLEKLEEENVRFLVVEPAKGEYKNVFGQFQDVTVYGTNPKKFAHILRINPFRFPSDIHVLEHLDRLVEIFNVCWPMYAAMPAILKDAMERAYVAAGWDLALSENPKGDIYPNFADVLEQIEDVIETSKYSADSKGDYSGALCTRVRSLTTGLNRLIFTENDLEDTELFDQNVIVDISRVGSMETKSLIMGILVMKLNEYRMVSGEMNSGLKHITVLEEAHNLLKRTSTEQSTESSNLLGKSVELLANSIAEMRTYGEGFIIADQSPGLLDMSAIRNTNTKIILRLPDQSDRELVGYAAGLDKEQIQELARLERGVAAVYQNDWVEPVLVQIEKCNIEEKMYEECTAHNAVQLEKIKGQILNFLLQGRVYEKLDFDVDEIQCCLSELQLSMRKRDFLQSQIEQYHTKEYLSYWENENFDKLSQKVVDFLGIRSRVEKVVVSTQSNGELTERLNKLTQEIIPEMQPSVREELNHCIMKDLSLGEDETDIRRNIYYGWVEYERGRRR